MTETGTEAWVTGTETKACVTGTGTGAWVKVTETKACVTGTGTRACVTGTSTEDSGWAHWQCKWFLGRTRGYLRCLRSPWVVVAVNRLHFLQLMLLRGPPLRP